MEKRTSATARILASLALVGAVVAIVVVVGSTGGDPAPDDGGRTQGATTTKQESKPKTKAKTYVIKTGDNLTLISEKTGVSVVELQALNPEIDPQVLVAGETLKLR